MGIQPGGVSATVWVEGAGPAQGYRAGEVAGQVDMVLEVSEGWRHCHGLIIMDASLRVVPGVGQGPSDLDPDPSLE